MATVYFANQYFSTTLNVGGGINNTQTTGIIIQDRSGLDATKPGVACISYSDPISTSAAEWVTYSSIDTATNELQGVTRGAEGFSAKTHVNGATIAFPISESHINNMATALSIGGVATNAVDGTLDEDDMSSNSATKLATQQSIKAYVDTSISLLSGSVTTVTSSATPTPVGDKKNNELYVTALAAAAQLQNPSGTPVNGNKLIVRIKDNGTARALTYTSIYRAIGVTLPTTTVINKTIYLGFAYNSADTKWDCLAVAEEA